MGWAYGAKEGGEQQPDSMDWVASLAQYDDDALTAGAAYTGHVRLHHSDAGGLTFSDSVDGVYMTVRWSSDTPTAVGISVGPGNATRVARSNHGHGYTFSTAPPESVGAVAFVGEGLLPSRGGHIHPGVATFRVITGPARTGPIVVQAGADITITEDPTRTFTFASTAAPVNHNHDGVYAPLSHQHDAYIPKAIIEATGDLIVGAAAGTPVRLAVGNDGQVLTANVQRPGGVEWAAGPLPFVYIAAVKIGADSRPEHGAGTLTLAGASPISVAWANGGTTVNVTWLPSADVSMGGFKLTDLGLPVADGDALQFGLAKDLFAPLGHTHQGLYAPVDHNHDGAYAPLAHNHDGTYAPLAHNHDGAYAPLNHQHDAYIPKAIGDAKGDLIGFSANDTPVRIPAAGQDGLFLKSLAAGTGGVEWGSGVTSIQPISVIGAIGPGVPHSGAIKIRGDMNPADEQVGPLHLFEQVGEEGTFVLHWFPLRDVSMGGLKLVFLGPPENDADAANKQYVDQHLLKSAYTAAGDMLYATAASTVAVVNFSAAGQLLVRNATVPAILAAPTTDHTALIYASGAAQKMAWDYLEVPDFASKAAAVAAGIGANNIYIYNP